MKKLLWIAITICLLCGCNRQQGNNGSQNAVLQSLMLVDTLQIKPSLIAEVRKYMLEHSGCKSFILRNTGLYKDLGCQSNGCNVHNVIYTLSPAYDYAFDGGEWSMGEIYPSRYFMLDGKIILLSSQDDVLFAQSALRKAYNSIPKVKKVPSFETHRNLLVDSKRNKVTVLPDLFNDSIRTISKLPPKPVHWSIVIPSK